MASPNQGVWPGAAHRVRPGWVLLQVVGNALLVLGAMAWLHIPDSHGWQFALSVFSALLLVAAFLWIYMKSINDARRPESRASYWTAGFWLFTGFAVSLFWMHVAAKLGNNVDLRAGYWNSQLSAHMRTVLTYPRLVEYQEAAIVALSWLVPLLLLPIVIELVTRSWTGVAFRSAIRVWLRWQYWIVAIAALFLGCWITSWLVDWHPTYTVRGEVVSVTLRLALAYCVDVLLGCGVLALTCELLSRVSPGKSAERDAAP
jgi:hypothetical protein